MASDIPIPDAMAAIKAHMATDPMFAWGRYCNIAVPLMDAGVRPRKVADEAAAFLMFHLFDHDITTHEYYRGEKPGVQQYAEVRIAAERAEDAAIASSTGRRG